MSGPYPFDKRDYCGCHKGCTTLPHVCERPCRWPDCLTTPEQVALVEEINAAERGEP